MLRDQDIQQKVETKHKTFETKYLQNITNLFNIKFWTMEH